MGEKQTSLGHLQGEQRGQLQHLKKWGCAKDWFKLFVTCSQGHTD